MQDGLNQAHALTYCAIVKRCYVGMDIPAATEIQVEYPFTTRRCLRDVHRQHEDAYEIWTSNATTILQRFG